MDRDPNPEWSNRVWGKHTGAGRHRKHKVLALRLKRGSQPEFLGSRLLEAFFTFHMAHLFFASLF